MILVGKIKNIAKYNLNLLGWYAKLKKGMWGGTNWLFYYLNKHGIFFIISVKVFAMPMQLRQEANKQTPRPWGLRQVWLWRRVTGASTGTAEGAVTLIVCVRAYLPEKAGYAMLIQLSHEVTWGAQWAAHTCLTQDRSVTYWIYLKESQVGFSSLCPGLEPRTSHMPDKDFISELQPQTSFHFETGSC